MGALASIVVGFWSVHKEQQQREAWFRFMMSLAGTAFCTFWFSWGSSIWYLKELGTWLALVLGFANATISMSLLVYLLWLRSPLTKGMGIMVPSKLAQQSLEQNTVYTEKPR